MSKDVMGVQEVSPGYEFVAGNPTVPVGYKQTEVGVIPEDWEIFPFGEHFSIYAGGDAPKHSLSSTQSDRHPYPVFANAIQGKGLYGFTAETRSKPDSVTVTARGYLGHAEYRSEPFFPIVRLLVLEPKGTLDSKYTSYAINDRVQFSIESTGVPQLTAPQVARYAVAAPPDVKEQKTIATALSDVDALLEELDRLIAKKRDIKQAAMQQLLTGETRLPGFEGEWEVKTLREIARIQRGASPRPIDSPIWFDDNSLIGWVRISDVTNSGMFLEKTSQKLSNLGVQHSRPVPAGSLIMSICATVGRPIVTKVDVCIHDGFVVFDSLDANQLFVFYFLKWIEPKWSQHGQTGSQMNLNTGLINGTEIKLPPMDEQRAIAECLFDMDTEIQALEQRRSKTAELKQGMMQELLTGRTRLV
ncbi:restriction endonuclease subunit S [uncultured Marinobacter sp.]|uniref:restriction endonuclease subunit S n=1 Tax=uncultured Marinobacter sp. TaxID=187379 RepID=UPI002595720E|nr:restriction endonuclease subunit S [uncultured Marinobacter sp.]